MKKLPSNKYTMILSLLILSSVCTVALTFVYNMTKDQIVKNNQAVEINALTKVVPEYDNNLYEEKIDFEDMPLYPAYKDGKLVAVVVKSFEMGFSDNVEVFVGVLADKSIYKAIVVKQKETPGLGALVEKDAFLDQFKNMNESVSVTKDGGSIVALTGATITSRAATAAVNKAFEIAKRYLEQNS